LDGYNDNTSLLLGLTVDNQPNDQGDHRNHEKDDDELLAGRLLVLLSLQCSERAPTRARLKRTLRRILLLSSM
jgi:hypothetical protein